MTPTEILKHEHRIISLVLDAAEREVTSMQYRARFTARGPKGCLISFCASCTDATAQEKTSISRD
jgi:hypothetical protein